MKKLIALLLAAAMIAGMLCACGSSKTDSKLQQPSKETASVQAENTPEQDDSEESAQGDSQYAVVEALLGEVLSLSDYEVAYEDEELLTLELIDFTRAKPDYCVQLGDGTTLQLPVHFGDLLDAGWVSEQQWADNQDGNTFGYTVMTNTNGKTIYAFVKNPSDEGTTLRDCWVTTVFLGGTYTEDFDVNGVSANATMAEIVAAWGLPTTVYCYQNDKVIFDYCPIDGTLEFRVDWNTGLLFEVRYGTDPA